MMVNRVGEGAAANSLPRNVIDHPLLGRQVTVPLLGTATVVAVTTAPTPAMPFVFDLDFGHPRPLLNRRGGDWQLDFEDRPDWHQRLQRFRGSVLEEMGVDAGEK